MDMDYGLVSIIMPNYNSEKYIQKAIESIIAQTYKNWELLFVDDCSKDNSLAVVSAFNDIRIKIFKNDKNKGAAATRNIAIENAQGRWIAFLDSDDLWTSDKLEIQLSYMQEKGCVFSFADYDIIGDDNKKLAEYKHKKDCYTYVDILKHNHIGCLTVIYDKEKLGKVFMPIEAVKREDHACWLSILKKDIKAYCIRSCLAKYRVHSNSVSSNKMKMVKYQWRVYRKIEKLSFFKCVYYMLSWAINGLIKYK